MQKIISDYDGIFIESELAKAYGWYIACKHDELSEHIEKQTQSSSLIERINSGDPAAEELLRKIQPKIRNELRDGVRCSGGTRFDFGYRMYRLFVKGEDRVKVLDEIQTGNEREATKDEREYVEQILTAKRSDVRQQLIDWFAEPIAGNLRFFKRLYQEMGTNYNDPYPIGLVTQSKSSGILKQFALRRRGDTIWTEFPELPTIFGEYEKESGFPYAECAGDKRGEAYQGIPKKDYKKIAYSLICDTLQTHETETLTFEDTRDGVKAAKEAGVKCVGVKEAGSTQDLSEADVVVEGSLYEIIDTIPAIVELKPEPALNRIMECLQLNKLHYEQQRRANESNVLDSLDKGGHSGHGGPTPWY